MTTLEARGIHADIDNKQVVHGVEFTAHAGGITTIVDPTGSGKSTLLKAITNEGDFTGKVAMNGQDCATLKPWEPATMRGVLPQAAMLVFPFTVIEGVRMRLLSAIARTCTVTSERALAKVGLARFIGVFTKNYPAKINNPPSWRAFDVRYGNPLSMV